VNWDGWVTGAPLWAVAGSTLVAMTVVVGFAWWAVRSARHAKKFFLEASREAALTYGTVLVDGDRSFPLTGLALREGKLLLTFPVPGPFESGARHARIQGADGLDVAETDVFLPDVQPGALLVVEVPGLWFGDRG